jgi:hypothetical protein
MSKNPRSGRSIPGALVRNINGPIIREENGSERGGIRTIHKSIRDTGKQDPVEE